MTDEMTDLGRKETPEEERSRLRGRIEELESETDELRNPIHAPCKDAVKWDDGVLHICHRKKNHATAHRCVCGKKWDGTY